MPLTDDEIRALRDGCEGVTPGPWLRQKREGHDTDRSIVGAADNTVAWSGHGNTKVADMNAAHIARCDPQTISELCKELLAWRESFPGYVSKELERTTNAD